MINVTNSELAAIVAGLQLRRAQLEGKDTPDVEDIATSNHTHEPLTAMEVKELIYKLAYSVGEKRESHAQQG